MFLLQFPILLLVYSPWEESNSEGMILFVPDGAQVPFLELGQYSSWAFIISQFHIPQL